MRCPREETDAPKGTVVAQDPAGGDEIDEGAAVDLVVSAGVAKVEVPELIGLTRSDAVKALSDAGLDSTETVEYDSLVLRDSVIDQVPAAGVKVVPGSTIGLLLSLGKKPVSDIKVPNVTGMTQNDAQRALHDAGLAAYFAMENDDTVPAGSVVEQAPAAGKKVAPSTIVLLAVSIGPAAPSAVTVPDVVGDQRDRGSVGTSGTRTQEPGDRDIQQQAQGADRGAGAGRQELGSHRAPPSDCWCRRDPRRRSRPPSRPRIRIRHQERANRLSTPTWKPSRCPTW